jgi:ParB family chromosome partitioning protein
MKRQALGKGLSSLIPGLPAREKADDGLLMLDVDRIEPSRFQPRTDFRGMESLADSIKQNGVIQPVVVRKDGDRFHLIAGERRWRAAQLAGIHRIPAVVRKAEEGRLLELALIENIQREDLNPIEEAKAYEILLTKKNVTQADVAKQVGRERSSVANSLRLLKLPQQAQDLVIQGCISFGHAKAILAIPDAATQIRIAEQVATKGLSVRETEAVVAAELRMREETPGASPAGRTKRGTGHADPNVAAAEDRLRQALGTKVRIRKRGERGRIEIEFYSDGELDRLFSVLTAAQGH